MEFTLKRFVAAVVLLAYLPGCDESDPELPEPGGSFEMEGAIYDTQFAYVEIDQSGESEFYEKTISFSSVVVEEIPQQGSSLLSLVLNADNDQQNLSVGAYVYGLPTSSVFTLWDGLIVKQAQFEEVDGEYELLEPYNFVEDGELTVEKYDDNYWVKYTLTDDEGNTVVGSYFGLLEFLE